MKSGFTLIEAAIVLAIVGIIAAIAWPAVDCKLFGKCRSHEYQSEGCYK